MPRRWKRSGAPREIVPPSAEKASRLRKQSGRWRWRGSAARTPRSRRDERSDAAAWDGERGGVSGRCVGAGRRLGGAQATERGCRGTGRRQPVRQVGAARAVARAASLPPRACGC